MKLKSKSPLTKSATFGLSAGLAAEYSFIELLGAGGTSDVSLVQRKSDRRQFAYKAYRPYQVGSGDNQDSASDFDNFRRAVLREIEITKNLCHPCVVPVSAAFPQRPEAGLLMPVVHGVSLIDIDRPMRVELLREIISSLAIALYYLELKSVVHGDFKPHNIFFPQEIFDSKYDFSRIFFPRLIDFSMGMQVQENTNLTSESSRIGLGTLGYSAPETLAPDVIKTGQASTSRVSYKSDLFSLGVIAYYLACGRHPFLFETADPATISAAVTEYTPPRLDGELENFPRDLAMLIQSMLAKEPALRPANGFAICEKLQKQGASYPFRRIIQPGHLLPLNLEQDIESLATLPGLNLPARNYLHRISNGDIRKIRIILNATFRSGKLIWNEGIISGTQDFHKYVWPRKLREWERREFSALTLSEARWIVRSAVAGDVGRLLQIIRPPKNLRPGVANSALVETVRHDLAKSTIRFQSRFLAQQLVSQGEAGASSELLATLQLQAEEIEKCSVTAFKYCESLKAENRQIEALPLLSKIAKYAESVDETAILIETLHRDADIRRDSGDMNGAESRYTIIVELSCSGDSRILAETYKDLGDLYKLKQDFTAGLKALQEAERLYRELGDTTELARVTNNMGNIYWIVSQYEKALGSYGRALKLHRKRGDLADISSTVNNIASIYAVTGRLERGIRIYLISLDMKRQLENPSEVARTLNNLGYTYYLQGKLPEALEVLEEALGINEVESSKKEIITNLDNFVCCAIIAGRFTDALTHIRRGRELAEELHDKHSKSIFDANLARIFLRTGQWDQALRLTLRSMSIARVLSDKVLEVGCLLVLAELYSQMQSSEKHADCIEQAMELSKEIGDKQAQIQCVLAQAASDEKQLFLALELARASKAPRDIALCEMALAENYLDSNEMAPATEYLNRAAIFFEIVSEDIDQLRFWRLWAEVQVRDSRSTKEELQEIYNKLSEADAQAQLKGECLQSWKLEIVLAEVGSKCGEYEGSYAALMRAMVTIRKLATKLPDKTSVQKFTRQPFMNRMSIEIMQLKQKLGVG